MTKLFAQALNLAVQVYIEEQAKGEQRDWFKYHAAHHIVDEGQSMGLIYFIGDLPKVRFEKMTNCA